MQRPALEFADPPAPITSSDRIGIKHQTIDVWPFNLRCADDALAEWEAMLDPVERARGQRLVRPEHRREFIVAHGVTRHILAHYLAIAPQALRFSRGAQGKPALTGIESAIEFNLSHSRGRALLAVATMPIGVDLEARRDDLAVMEIAERYFFGAELASIRSQPTHEQTTMFFRFWVAKEAVLKAEGIGLGYPLDRFAVRFAEHDYVRATIQSSDPCRLSSDWRVRLLGNDPSWPAAVTAKGINWRAQQRSLQRPNTPHPFP